MVRIMKWSLRRNRNRSWHFPLLIALGLGVGFPARAAAQTKSVAEVPPVAYTYKRVGEQELKAYVFLPEQKDHGKPRAAMLVFHGGGWTRGQARWTFGQANYFATLGMVGISIEYRLANGTNTTPFDGVEDGRDAVRWARSQAKWLNIDPRRIAAYGESAGGMLAAATAITTEPAAQEELRAVPNALVLVSPALNNQKNPRFLRLLGPGQDSRVLDPGEHIRPGMPPTIILTGALDEAVPPETLVEYCEKMRQAKNRCDLQIYPGVGHMLEPVEEEGKTKASGTQTKYNAYLKADQFLVELGFIKVQK